MKKQTHDIRLFEDVKKTSSKSLISFAALILFSGVGSTYLYLSIAPIVKEAIANEKTD